MLLAICCLLCIDTQGCPEDLNEDSIVSVDDILILIAGWGDCPPKTECLGDVNLDGVVNVNDLIQLIGAWGDCPSSESLINYPEALQRAVMFYEYQQSGEIPDVSRAQWRGDSFVTLAQEQVNAGPFDVDLANRYMDAGDTPTFVLPITSAMTMISWSAIQWSEGYVSTGQMDEVKNVIRWHADWCIEAHPFPNVFCGQIGDGTLAHNFFGPPEVHPNYIPRIHWLTTDFPGSEPAAEAAAFLSASSILFMEEDPVYAASLLSHAQELFLFAYEHQGMYHESIPDVKNYYFSWNGYYDELAWGATWLYLATNDSSWLEIAQTIYNEHFLDSLGYWTQSWGDKQFGTAILLAWITDEENYKDAVEDWLMFWSIGTDQGDRVEYTDGGLAWLSQWGSLRYAANTAMLSLMYVDLLGDLEDGSFYSFSKSQIDYILGNNPMEFSYVCGFGENYPAQPHHGGGSGVFDGNVNWPQDNRHVLHGALVGGPKSPNDFDYQDVRGDWIGNEVATDYNAGLTGALACLSITTPGDVIPDSDFPPLEDTVGKEFFVEAAINELNDHSVELWCWINNRSAWPARSSTTLSYRIFLDLTEVFDAGLTADDVYTINIYSTGGQVGEVEPWDVEHNVYSVKIDYTNRLLVPGAPNTYHKICKIRIGIKDSNSPFSWDVSNDPSISGLPMGGSNVEKTPFIPVYEKGTLFWGIEPNQ